MEHFVRINLLCDFYGQMLTEKQRQAVEMHFGMDLSLSEIADELGVSRQAVHDLIKRSQEALEEYEQRLGLAGRFLSEQAKLADLSQLLTELADQTDVRWQQVWSLLGELTK